MTTATVGPFPTSRAFAHHARPAPTGEDLAVEVRRVARLAEIAAETTAEWMAADQLIREARGGSGHGGAAERI